MQYVKLFARLGNQLFQYAYGCHLRAQGERVRFLLSPGPGSIDEVFDLKGEGLALDDGSLRLPLLKFWARYVARSYRVGFFQEARFAGALEGSGRPAFRRRADYERSPWYALACGTKSVSVHIRGGDYLVGGAAKLYGAICTKAYYLKALARLRAELGDIEVLVFTDDAPYAEGVLGKEAGDYRLVRDGAFAKDPGFDLFLMGECAHHVISNSTFAWWGAFFGGGAGRFTIAPARWSQEQGFDIDSLLPREWIRIASDP